MADILSGLESFKWRAIEFPVAQMRVSSSQDLVEHKYWSVDGARIEATGRNPLRFTASIPFRLGIATGKNERWADLYPSTFRKFLVAMADRSTGVLAHPELGEIACKPHNVDVTWAPDRRDGCDVDAEWVETRIEGDLSPFEDKSPVASADTAAIDLDAAKQDLKSLVRLQLELKGLKLPEYEESFESAMNKITGVVDQGTLMSKRFAGRIDSIKYRVGAFGDAVARGKTPLTWPIIDAVERVKSAANAVKQDIAKAGGRDVVVYVVQVPTTLAGLLPHLEGATVADVIRLNPGIVAAPTIPVGTAVRYYKPRIKT